MPLPIGYDLSGTVPPPSKSGGALVKTLEFSLLSSSSSSSRSDHHRGRHRRSRHRLIGIGRCRAGRLALGALYG
jgi:hypothetical protein